MPGDADGLCTQARGVQQGGGVSKVVDVDERAVEEVKLQVQLQKEERPGAERREG